ncbi:AraC family transcriptional regulator ligand-binding domain-containing protein [Aquabacterium sp.]|uniref:AraC family transcriptional regulator ligand-binding domain-containing protein n=1 Tax=Aquabacterium sp. TaxID=1872578 RepID=UPI0035AF46AD
MQHALSPDAIFVESGLQQCLGRAASLSEVSDSFTRAWEIAVHESGNPAIGLTTPSHPLKALGVLSNLVVASSEVLTALQRLVRFADIVSPTVAISVKTQGDRCCVETDIKAGRLPVASQRYDHMATVLLHAMHWVTGRPIVAAHIHMPPSTPSSPSRWREAFGCPVTFGTRRFVMEFNASDMTQTIPTADPIVADMCERLVAQVAERNHSSVSARVRRMLEDSLSEGDPRREAVAARLCMSERTLQRRLTDEGTTFADLVDVVRREMAERLLVHGNLTPTEMSFALGFSDPSNFYRACKRWFGRSPRVLRETVSQFPDTISTF